MLPINLVSVFVAAVAAFVLGFLFHGPIFGKLWMKLANIHPTGNEKFSDMIPQMFWNLVSNFVTAYVLATIFLYTLSSTYLTGSQLSNSFCLSFLLWLGFIVTSSSMEVIWMKRSFKLWLFEAVCSLVMMATMGAIIAGW